MPREPRFEHTFLGHLDAPGTRRAIPKLWAFYVDLAMSGSVAPAGAAVPTGLECRFRPDRKACPGILVVHRAEVPSMIRWECSGCRAGGVLQGWEQTEWDLSGDSALPWGDEEQYLHISFPRTAHRVLRDLVREDRRWRAPVHAASVADDRAYMPVPRSEAEDFSAWLVGARTAVRSQRRRQLLAEVRSAWEQRQERERSGSPPAGAPARGRHLLYRLEIALRDTQEPIWRWVLVPANLSLAALHEVFQIAMGWQDCHLHLFRVGDRILSPADRVNEPFGEDSTGLTLQDIVPGVGSRFEYQYDFGDCWVHDVVVEEAVTSDDPRPRCLAGRRACPPEDCGGVPGYEKLLAALGDPAHEEHEFLLEWAGGPIDPERFDASETDGKLAALELELQRR